MIFTESAFIFKIGRTDENGEIIEDSVIDVGKLTTDFTVDDSPGNEESFKCFDGTVINPAGDVLTISAELKKVPTEIARRISEAVSSENLYVEFTNPLHISGKFRKTKYTAKTRSKGFEYDISMTLESAAAGSSRL